MYLLSIVNSPSVFRVRQCQKTSAAIHLPNMDQFDSFLAGWVGGASSVFFSHPLDTVKVRLQTTTTHKGTLDCLKQTLKREGVRGLYKGMAFPLCCFSSYNAVAFGIYKNTLESICHTRYGDRNAQPGLQDMVPAAMMGGGFSVMVGAPLELVKIRLQVQTECAKTSRLSISTNHVSSAKSPVVRRSILLSRATSGVTTEQSRTVKNFRTMVHPQKPVVYSGPFHVCRHIIQTQGIKGFYRGSSAMLIRDLPGYTFYFVPYELLRRLFNLDPCRPTPVATLIAGGLAGTISWTTSHPLDTIKTRMQSDFGRDKRQYRNWLHCVSKSYAEEGLAVFFRGVGVNALRGFPQSAALFLGYEMTIQFFKDFRTGGLS